MSDTDLEIQLRCEWCGGYETLHTSSAGIALQTLKVFSDRHYACKEGIDE